MLDSTVYLDAIRTNAADLYDAAEGAGIDERVPTCPDWDVAELLGHIGRVHRWAAGNSRRAPTDEFWPGNEIEIPERAARPAWARAGTDELLAALDRPAEEPSWTWLPPATVGFWQRRQAHETAMHRVDAQSATGEVQPIDAALAADGIDEYLELVRQIPWKPAPTGDGETMHLHCTDVPGEWLVTLRPDGVHIEREHAKGDVAARGAASDLLCWLQGRAPLDRLEVFGDDAILTRWREAARF